MESIRLTVVSDWAQSESVCVQLSEKWARVLVSWPAPINAGDIIAHLLMRAARMLTAGVGAFDLAAADINVALSGHDMRASDELHGQVLELWTRALVYAKGAAVGPAAPTAPTGAATPTGAAVGLAAVGPAAPAALGAPRARPSPGLASALARASTLTAADASTSTVLVTKIHARHAEAEPGGAADSRRAQQVRSMVQTVQQYVKTYGAAPDFASNKPAVIEKVHNYIRSTTAGQQAPIDVLEAVRAQLARER